MSTVKDIREAVNRRDQAAVELAEWIATTATPEQIVDLRASNEVAVYRAAIAALDEVTAAYAPRPKHP